MKIQIKNIQFSEAMSEETNAFAASLYINGKKVGGCKNTGQGGCTDYWGDTPEDREIIKEAEDYFRSQPKKHSERFNFDYQPTLELAIGDCLDEWLQAKEQKRMTRQMAKAVLVGIPDAPSYSLYKFKVPLKDIPQGHLQAAIFRIKNKLKKGEVILNTNLEPLGITI